MVGERRELPYWRAALGSLLALLGIGCVGAWIVFQFITPSWNAVWLIPAAALGLSAAWAFRWEPAPDSA